MDTNVMAVTTDGSTRWVRLSSEGLYPSCKRPDPAVRNLALAILLQALRDVIAPKGRHPNRRSSEWRKDAVDWFLADDNRCPGSFTWVRDILGIESDDLQNWVRAYQVSSPTARHEMVKQVKHIQITH